MPTFIRFFAEQDPRLEVKNIAREFAEADKNNRLAAYKGDKYLVGGTPELQ